MNSEISSGSDNVYSRNEEISPMHDAAMQFFEEMKNESNSEFIKLNSRTEKDWSSWSSVEEFMDSDKYESWIDSLSIGDIVDAVDVKDKWYPASVLDFCTENGKRLYVHYQGWASRWDEWINCTEKRIAPLNSHMYGMVQNEEKSERPLYKFHTYPMLSLQSANHDKMMINNIRSLYYHSELSDFALSFASDSDKFKNRNSYYLHTPILKSRCPGIFDFLEECKAQNDLVKENASIPLYIFNSGGVSANLLEDVIDYAYTGKALRISGHAVKESLNFFSALRLSGLKDLVLSCVNESNVVEFLEASSDINLQSSTSFLLPYCINMFREHASVLISSRDVLSRLYTLPQSILVGLLQNIVPHISPSGSKKRRRVSDPQQYAVFRRRIDDQFPASDSEVSPVGSPQSNREDEHILDSDLKQPETSAPIALPHITLDPFFLENPIFYQYIQDLDNLFFDRSPENSDMIVQVDEKKYFVHSCILATQSSFFNALVKSQMSDKRYVSICGHFSCDETFDYLLRFMYSGYIGNLNLSVACDLMRCLDFFGLKSQTLKRACRIYIYSKTDSKNILNLASFTLNHLKDADLLQLIITKLSLMPEKIELIQKIRENELLVEIIKTLIFNDDNDDSISHIFDDQVRKRYKCIYVLSDECSELLNFKDCLNIEDLIARVAESGRPSGTDGLTEVAGKLSTLLGGRTHVGVKNGELSALLSRHLTRVQLF